MAVIKMSIAEQALQILDRQERIIRKYQVSTARNGSGVEWQQLHAANQIR